MKAVKNFGLLSFGEEAEGDEESIEKVRRSIISKSIIFFLDHNSPTRMRKDFYLKY